MENGCARVSVDHTADLRQLVGQPADLTNKERASHDALDAELAVWRLEYADVAKPPADVDQWLRNIETALAAFAQRPPVYDRAEVAPAGIFVGSIARAISGSSAAMSGRTMSRRPNRWSAPSAPQVPNDT
jgi:hypothetical protein